MALNTPESAVTNWKRVPTYNISNLWVAHVNQSHIQAANQSYITLYFAS